VDGMDFMDDMDRDKKKWEGVKGGKEFEI